jgi:hypothetical protein
MVPKTSDRVLSICLKAFGGKELGSKNRLAKDAVTFYILRCFAMDFNGFCTILYQDFRDFFTGNLSASRCPLK